MTSMRSWVLSLVLAGSAASCGGDAFADIAMDRKFRAGEAMPVHPPRGQRGVPSPAGAISMRSDAIDCGDAGEVTHTNVTLRISGPVGARVRGDCRLQLTNVDLVATDGVVLEGGSLIMVGGSITATGVGVRVSTDAAVELTDVDVEGATGIQAAGDARVTTKGGRVTGSSVSVSARGRAKVVLQGTELHGPTAHEPSASLTIVKGDAP